MANASVTIEVSGANRLKRAFKALGETDAPFLREALQEGGQDLAQAARSRARGNIAASVRMQGVLGSGGALRAKIVVDHPGAKAMEFGRKKYYRGYTGRRQKATGTMFTASRGQRAQPFIGIKSGGQAVAATRHSIGERLIKAFDQEWERLGRGPD